MRLGDIQDLSLKHSGEGNDTDKRRIEILLDEQRERTSEENWRKISKGDFYHDYA